MACVKRGSVIFNSKQQGVELTNVLYCPTLSENLLSVSKLCNSGYKVLFDGQTVSCFKDHVELPKELLWRGVKSKRDGLWRVVSNSGSQALSLTSQSSQEICDDMHSKLGHANVKDVVKFCNDHGIGKIKAEDCSECISCIIGKNKRSSMHPTDNRADRNGSRLHTDICGPLVADINGNQYLITFTDDQSRFTLAFLMKRRSEAIKCFKYVHQKLRNEGICVQSATFGEHKMSQFSLDQSATPVVVQSLRSDNAKEYLSNEFAGYLQDNGIMHELTVPYTPEQNGVSERKNLTIFNKVRTMLIESKLPEQFWGQAALAAVYLSNISPSSSNPQSKSPYEVWSGRLPKSSHLQIFGQHSFVHVPVEKRSKLDRRAVECIFMGYTESTSILRFYDIVRQKLITSNAFTFPKEKRFGVDLAYDSSQNSKAASQETTLQEFTVPLMPPVHHHSSQEATVQILPLSQSQPTEDLDMLQAPQSTAPAMSSSPNNAQPGSTVVVVSDSTPSAPKEIVSRVDPSNIVSGKRVRKQFKALTTKLQRNPQSVREALSGPDRDHYYKAMMKEINGLENRKTWRKVQRQKGDRVIKCRWVFTKKKTAAGDYKFKARLVAKGYSQVSGVDYQETYAPTARTNSLRIMLSKCASLDYEIEQVDAVQAFVVPELKEEIYMEVPEGGLLDCGDDVKLQLLKTLYGLKQAAAEWYNHLMQCLAQPGFVPTEADHCLFYRKEDDALILAHVDDMLLGIKGIDQAQKLKKDIASMIEITDLGPASYFLGLHIERDRQAKTILLHQHRFIAELLEDYQMSLVKPAPTPMDSTVSLSLQDCPQTKEEQELMQDIPYQQVVGALLYTACATRPDISAAVGKVCKFSSNPGQKHWTAVKRICKYLKGTSKLGIQLGGEHGTVIQGWSDADWAGDTDGRKSTGGYLFKLANSPVSWQSKLQNIVALSSCESEYIALSNSAQEAIWLRRLLQEIGWTQDAATLIHEDNQGAIAVINGNKTHSRTKHIDVRHHFIRTCVRDGHLRVVYCPTDLMLADILTKPLPTQKFLALRDMMGMSESVADHGGEQSV
ncbi:hypothetical protein MP228_009762 [Amoeboaphelidium protococcarum]|nr:hypothetical protein MP228_009762 [Amoeboaphelidium protococcarum]